MQKRDTDAALDEYLELKKRSRRRLVGAAALALLAAVILPMVMDHEPRQPAQDIQVRIPSHDSGGFSPLSKPAIPALPVESASGQLRQPVAVASPSEAVRTSPVVVAAATPSSADKPASVVPLPKPVDRSAEQTGDKLVEKQREKPVAKPVDEARTMAPIVSAPAGEEWVVQLGAYKEPGNVKVLLGKLKQMAMPAYTENFESPAGARTRVRAGPFKTREAAEKAQARIRKIGVDGPVALK
jgi:DedD protein